MTETTNVEALRGEVSEITNLFDAGKFIAKVLDQLEAERQRASGSEQELHKALHREKAAERKLLAAQEEIAELKGEQVPVATMHRLVNHRTGQEHPWICTLGDIKAGEGDIFRVEVKPLFAVPQKLSNLPYDVLFNAIGKAVNIQGEALSISVKAFKEAIESAGGLSTPQATIEAAPPKPVVLPGISELIDACDSTPAVRDVHVWDLAISEVKRLNPSLFSDKSAAGIVVKDGE